MKCHLVLFIFILIQLFGNGQTPKNGTFPKKISGNIAYYFWEEDTLGNILNQHLIQPYKRNIEVQINNKRQSKYIPTCAIENGILHLIENTHRFQKLHHFKYDTDKAHVQQYQVSMEGKLSQTVASIVIVHRNNKWISIPEKKVLYLNHFADSTTQFSHASDSILLTSQSVAIMAQNHYTVHTYWNQNNKISNQIVFNYAGEDVTSTLFKSILVNPKRVLIFANGYRGPSKNKDKTDNLITTFDRFNYWLGIDKAFVKRLTPAMIYYIDGNHGIRTSAHRSMIRFGISIGGVKATHRKNAYCWLNTKPNVNGFYERKEAGKKAGEIFVLANCNALNCTETKDTVDIVCHSMGYSYALGFIEAIQDKVVFGKIYIIAPENGNVGGTDWKMFEEVWQYGTNLDQPNPDPVWEQDGIAPQAQVFGLETVPTNKGGRVFFPADWPIKNFVDSHMLYNYMWMFDSIRKGEKGYIHR